MHSALHIALLVLLGAGLSLRVIYLRRQLNSPWDDGGHPPLRNLLQSQASYSMFAPVSLCLLLALEMSQAPPWAVHITGAAMILGQCGIILGLSSGPENAAPRALGLIFSNFSWIFGAILLLWFASHPVG